MISTSGQQANHVPLGIENIRGYIDDPNDGIHFPYHTTDRSRDEDHDTH
ncbi:BQ2448_6673 [Microbotryum intermedium]|uniref:BQ2448_6673 protein n=1 Tax=Microbotryum intermedium TaxID=269621 RepID=A0A238FPW4_9BASI|nr:BQ2448_6673 [Microbotryum intermedium]